MRVARKAVGAVGQARNLGARRPSRGPLRQAGSGAAGFGRSRRRGRKRRRGAALVEFAVVAPLLFLLILAIFEFGRMVMVQQIITNAAREGARRAILEQSTVPEVEETITNYLAESSISSASVTVSPDPLTSAGFADPITVTCSVSYDQVSWVPAPWFLRGKTLTARSTMGAERLE